MHIVIARHVSVKRGADALAVPHFAKHPPVGGGDALDGADGAVGIESNIHCSISVKACILRGDLAVCGKLFDQLLRGEKTPLAVRNGNGVKYLPPLFPQATEIASSTRVRTSLDWWRPMTL